MPDEYKIILEVQHREELAKLQKDFASAHQQLQLLNQGLNQGTISQGAFDARSKVLAGTLNNLHGQITKLNSAVKGGILGGGGAGGGFNAQGLLQSSYLIDDLQYGLKSIVNNIPQVVMGLGGSAGIAGALGIAAVAVNVLSNHWDDFFGKADDKFPTLKEGLVGLEDNLKKIGDVIAKLKAEGKEQGFFSPLLEAIGLEGNAADRAAKINQLGMRMKEGQQRLKDESLLESTGPEHTKAAEENAAAVAKAIKALPQGSETLMSTLTGNGMKADQARSMIAGSMRGNVGNLEDMLKALPDLPMFRDLARAHPEARAAAKIEEDKEKADKKAQEEAAAAQKKLNDAGFKAFVKGQKDDTDRARNRGLDLKIEARKDQIEGLEDQKNQILDRNKSQHFGDTASFVRSMQQGILDKIPKEQLEKLKSIDKNIASLKDDIKKIGLLR